MTILGETIGCLVGYLVDGSDRRYLIGWLVDYLSDAFPADTGTCSTISIPKPSRPATLRGWLVSRRMRFRFRSDKICAPIPISRWVLRWLSGSVGRRCS